MMTEEFLAVQWLRLHTSKARGMGLIPGWGTKVSGVTRHSRKIKSQLKKKNSFLKKPLDQSLTI